MPRFEAAHSGHLTARSVVARRRLRARSTLASHSQPKPPCPLLYRAVGLTQTLFCLCPEPGDICVRHLFKVASSSRASVIIVVAASPASEATR